MHRLFDTTSRICETQGCCHVRRTTLSMYTVPKWRNWQTRVVQVHVLARVWGFESLLRHQSFKISSLERFYRSCYVLQPLTGRRWLSLALAGKWPSQTYKASIESDQRSTGMANVKVSLYQSLKVAGKWT